MSAAGKARAATVTKRPAGSTGVIAAGLVVVAAKVGLDLSAEDAAVLIGAAVAIVSKFTPRAAE